MFWLLICVGWYIKRYYIGHFKYLCWFFHPLHYCDFKCVYGFSNTSFPWFRALSLPSDECMTSYISVFKYYHTLFLVFFGKKIYRTDILKLMYDFYFLFSLISIVKTENLDFYKWIFFLWRKTYWSWVWWGPEDNEYSLLFYGNKYRPHFYYKYQFKYNSLSSSSTPFHFLYPRCRMEVMESKIIFYLPKIWHICQYGTPHHASIGNIEQMSSIVLLRITLYKCLNLGMVLLATGAWELS